MPRYYKEKIYDEFQRIMAGKYQRDKMYQEQEKEIKKLGMERYLAKKLSNHLGAISRYNYQNKLSNRSKI